MKLAIFEPAEVNALIETNDRGEFTVKTANMVIGPVAWDPDPIEAANAVAMPVPRWVVEHCLIAATTLDFELERIKADADLSPAGKAKKAQPHREHAVATVATVNRTLLDHEFKVESAERSRYQVPALNGQDLGLALRDFEIRQAMRSMRPDEVDALLHELGTGQNSDLLLAMLRSPLKSPRVETIARTTWTKLIDERDPAGRAQLDLQKASIDWARRWLAHVVGNLSRIHGFDRTGLFAIASKSGGQTIFGFDDRESAALQLQMQRRTAA